MSSSILSVFKARCFVRIDLLVFSISLVIFSRSRICHVRFWRSIDNDWPRYGIMDLLNLFLYLPFVSALSLSITRNLYFYCQQSQHNVQNLLYDVHVGIHVIVVNIFQVSTILFERNQQICVVVYQMFRYLRVRLTEIKTDVCVAAHREIFSYHILLVACHVINDKNRIWPPLVRWKRHRCYWRT